MTSPSDISSHNVLYHADEVYDQLKLAAQAQPHRMNSPAIVCLEAALFERDPEWPVPMLWRSEFRNILAGYMRRNAINFQQACALHHEAEGLLAGLEFAVDSNAVLAPVRDSDCRTYDCEFVVLSDRLDCPLVTLDKQFLRAFPRRTQALAAA